MTVPLKCIKDFPPANGVRYNESLWYQQHGDAMVIINCCSSGIYYPEHWTPLSFKFACTGKEYYKLRNTTYAVNDDYFLVLNEGNEYESYIPERTMTESLTVNYTRTNVNQLIASVTGSNVKLLDNPFPVNNETFSFIEKLYPYGELTSATIERLRKQINAERPDSFALTETSFRLLEIVFQLNGSSISEIDTIDAKKRSTKEELYKRLTIAQDCIRSCYDSEITIQQVADASCLNPFYLLRQFKKRFGATPHQYLTSVRLKQAEKLVLTSQKTIATVMNEVGFEDLTSFGKLFKKKFGLSPTQYRNLQEQKRLPRNKA